MKIFSVTNHTGSKNRGAEALVRTIALEIKKRIPDATLILHSNDHTYDRYVLKTLFDHYIFSYIIKTPNHLKSIVMNKLVYFLLASIEKIIKKELFSTLSRVKKSDLTIITGGDILTSDYKNFRKHAAYMLESQKVYICGQTVGPFNQEDEKYFLKSLKNVAYITARELESYEYLKSLDIEVPIEYTADVAFLLPTLDDTEYSKLKTMINFPFEDQDFITLSISRGIIKYSELDEQEYIARFKKLIRLITDDGHNIVIIPHVQETKLENNDLLFDQELVRELNDSKIFLVGHSLNSTEYKTIISKSIGLIGTRTHTTIASYSTLVPTISIAYSRKAYGIAKDIFQDEYEDFVFDVKNFDPNLLYTKFKHAMTQGVPETKIEEIKQRARKNFDILETLI